MLLPEADMAVAGVLTDGMMYADKVETSLEQLTTTQ